MARREQVASNAFPQPRCLFLGPGDARVATALRPTTSVRTGRQPTVVNVKERASCRLPRLLRSRRAEPARRTSAASPGVRRRRGLARAGWSVQDKKNLSLFAAQGIAVREVVMRPGHGRADYCYYVDRKVVGVRGSLTLLRCHQRWIRCRLVSGIATATAQSWWLPLGLSTVRTARCSINTEQGTLGYQRCRPVTSDVPARLPAWSHASGSLRPCWRC
jgi:hypothetical protein